MSAVGWLVVILVVYTGVGVTFSLNLGDINNRLAAYYAPKPWILRQFGRDNPNAYRAGGLVMLSFGVITLSWLLLSGITTIPSISRGTGATLLLATAMGGLILGLWVIRARRRDGGDKW